VDLSGNVIGFGGRVLDDSKPKYLNTGTTPVFDKGSNLFSMNFAKNSSSRQIILCEGYMDVIAVHQAGLENAVATLGTAITPNQARLVSHYADEVIIAYDSDSAGQSATRKAISHFTDVGVKTRILRMEGAKDPDEYIKKFGAQRFRILIEKSRDANNFLLDRCENDIDINTESGKVELLKRVSNVLADIPSSLEREVYISRTAGKYNFPADVLKLHIDNILRKNKNTERKKENRTIYTQTVMAKDEINPEAEIFRKESKAEEEIISFLMRFPEEIGKIIEKAPADIFVTPFNKRVYSAILSNIAEHGEFSLTFLNSQFSADEISRISGISAKKQNMSLTRKSFDDCVSVLKNHVEIPKDGIISDDELKNMLKKKSEQINIRLNGIMYTP
ncbi:MAG: toprim domain-containing protein, partial [Ruminococcus sp.]|nr:toprim domain-containing protein [Ruminococcus sp.]